MKTYSSKPGEAEKKNHIKCPLCNQAQYNEYWDLGTYSFSKCPKCSLVYQNPQPVSEHIHERYDNSYFNYEIENEAGFLNLMLLGLKDIGFTPYRVKEDSMSILDIGCATGLFLSHMKDLGWKTKGVEVCQDACEYGNRVRGVDIYHGVLEDAGLKEESFDIIHLSHVIEHVNCPKEFLDTIYSLLKPGGTIYCTTPNVSGFQAKLFKIRWRSAIADHLFLFSVTTLRKFLIKSGFKELRYKTWGGLCKGSGYPSWIKTLADRLSKPLGFGDVMIFKGVKK